MRRFSSARAQRLTATRVAVALAASLLAAAPASAGSPQRKQGAAEDAASFTVKHSVRISSSARGEFQRAVQLLNGGRYADAIPLLERVTAAAPKAVAAHVDLGMAYERTGDLVRAEASLGKALEASPHHPVALNELGRIQRKTGRFAEARKSYEQALAHFPTFRFAQRNLAILCDLYLADRGCALEHYQRYAQLAPNDAAVVKWIADLRARGAPE
jgi:Tfp pilus assembly protein PilF